MKRTKTLTVLGVLVLFTGLLVIPAASSDHMFGDDFKQTTSQARQLANSNIQQSAGVFAPGPGDVYVDQEANSNIQQDTDVRSGYGDAFVDQEANSNIEQDTTVASNGHGKASVDQRANSNIQQNADVKTTPVKKTKYRQPVKEKVRTDRPKKHYRPDRDRRKKHRADKRRKGKKKYKVDRPRKGKKKYRADKRRKGKKKHRVGKRKARGKKTICHVPPGNPSNAHYISVGKPAVAAHAAHGDNPYACKKGKSAKHGKKYHKYGYGKKAW